MNSRSRFSSLTLAVAACYGCVLISELPLTAQKPSSEPRTPRFGYLSDGLNPAGPGISADEADRLAKQLDANPEDSDARAKQMKFYWFSGARQPRLDLIFWLIEHHPDSE